ncbi:MAG: hypothetical protein IJW36_01795 [Clostridia bacterium]|nr:hypothetical protein [Clostridia bacterium]
MEFLEIFTQMHWVSAMLLIVGATLMIVELFVPGFGFWGVSGSVSIIAGIIVRICMGLNLVQSITLILLVLGFFIVIIAVMIYGAQYGILGKTGLFERRSTLAKDYNKTSKELRKLVGRSGKAISNLDLAGQAKIRGKIYDVVSISSYIEKSSNIKVVEIKDNSIMVRKWFE